MPAAKRKPIPSTKKETLPAVHQPQTDAQAFIAMIERAAKDPAIDVAKLKELLAIRNEEQGRIQKQEFAAALVSCQDGMVPIRKDMKADRFKYASYQAVDDVLRPIYSQHGFSLSFNSEPMEGNASRLLIICDVLHRSGQERRYSIPISVSTEGPKGGKVMTQTQGEGAAVSFGRRYLLLMIFNVVTHEDNAAFNPQAASKVSAEQLADLKAKIKDAALPLDKFELAFGPVNDLPLSRLQEAFDRVAQFKTRGFKKEEATADGQA